MDPPTWYRDQTPPITIHGKDLYLGVRTDLQGPDPVAVLSDISGWLGGLPLTDIRRSSNSIIEATAPAGLDLGSHDLEILLPRRPRATLLAAVNVTPGPDPDPTHLTHLENAYRSITVIPTDDQFADVTIDAVDLERTVLFYNYTSDAIYAVDTKLGVSLVDSTTLRFERYTPSAIPWYTTGLTVSWKVLEFAEGVRVQRGRTDLPPGAYNPMTSVTLSRPVNLEHAFLICTSFYRGRWFDHTDWALGWFEDEQTLIFDVPWAGSDGARVDWQVVEVEDATVQTGTSVLSDTTLTVDIVTSPLETSLLLFNHDVEASLNIPAQLIEGRLQSPTEIVFERAAVDGASRISWFVVNWPGVRAFHGREVLDNGTAATEADLGATVDIDRSVSFLSGLMRQGTSTYNAETIAGTGWFITELPTASRIGMQRGAALGAGTAAWTVVEFPP